MKRNTAKIIVIIFFILVNKIWGQIAVFPFEDLSRDINGLDFKVSKIIAKKLIDDGYDVIFPMEIMFFLERNNIPFTGWVDRITAKKIERIFGAKLILLGTILERSKKDLSFGITIRLISMPEYKLVWAKTVNFKKSENITFLNLKSKNWNEIIDFTTSKLLKNIPEIVLSKSIAPPDIDIKNVFINPRYAKSGERIKIKVSLKFSSVKPNKIFLIFSNNKQLVKLKNNTIYYSWKAKKNEGRYPISLEALWEKPYKIKKDLFLSTYVIDDTPPNFEIHPVYTTKINGTLYFSKFIKLIPHLKVKENISKWILKINSKEDNKTVAEIKNYGNLPAFFIWKGNTIKGAILPNGIYFLNLILWDKAGNKSKKTIRVYLVKTIVPPKVKAKIVDNNTIIDFKIFPHPVKINYFRIEIYDLTGKLIAYKLYDKIKKNIKIKIPRKYKKLRYSIDVRDILGNRLIQKKIPISVINNKQKRIIKNKRKIWINEF